jgi:hypothetical protein
MKQLNEIKRMQLLAGLITESQLSEIKSFTYEDDINFKWKSQPANPKSILTDTDSGEEFTKASYWESDIIGTDPLDIFPAYGSENSDGTWTLTFDEGEFSGFVEGEDFTFGDEETNNLNEDEENDLDSFDINQDWNKIKILGLETDHQGEWVMFADPEDPYLDEEGYSFAIEKRQIDQVANGEKIGVEDGSSISHYMTSQDAKKILSQI